MVLRPVDNAVFQIGQSDFGNRNMLPFQCVFGVFRPFVGSGNDNAVAEVCFTRCGEEAVDIFLLQRVVRCVVFALDSVVFASEGGGDQVDACVGCAAQIQFV